MIWRNTLSLPYGNQKFKGIKKEIRAVNRKQGSEVALEVNFAPTPCSLPCVMADTRPPLDNTFLVLFFQVSVFACGWAAHEMVPVIFTAFLRSCGYSKPSCSCLWSKVKTLWEEVTKALELCPWQQMPFALSSHGTHSSSRTITEYNWAKYATWVQRKGFAKPDTTTVLPLWNYDECLCSQHWLFISRSCHFFIWDHLAEVFWT